MRNTLQERVQRGVTLLDAYRPGWRTEIDTDTLNLGSTSNCVLGQLYRSHVFGIDALNISGWGAHYGFDSRTEADDWNADIEELTDLWLDQINPTTKPKGN